MSVSLPRAHEHHSFRYRYGLGGFVGGYFFDLNGDYFGVCSPRHGNPNLLILVSFRNRINGHEEAADARSLEAI